MMNLNVMMQALVQRGLFRPGNIRAFFSLWILLALSSCWSTKEATRRVEALQKTSEDSLVVLVDDYFPLYRQVITGIHVASLGNYRLLPFHEERFSQSALLNELLHLKPRALIALGPRSANVITGLRLLLPSAFSMVPRIDNYGLDNVFSAGIRMVPDLKVQIGLVRALMPDLKALGVIFSRQNSRALVQKLRLLCDDEQFELVQMEVENASNVLPALARESREFQALLMLDDPVLLELEVLLDTIRFLAAKKIAMFALDCSMVKEGALFSFETNFFTLGKDLVKLTQKNGSQSYHGTALFDPSELDICVNLTTADQVGNTSLLLSRAAEYASEKKAAIKVYR